MFRPPVRKNSKVSPIILPYTSSDDGSKGSSTSLKDEDEDDEELSLKDLERMEQGKLTEILQNSQEIEFFGDRSNDSDSLSVTESIDDFDVSGADLNTSGHGRGGSSSELFTTKKKGGGRYDRMSQKSSGHKSDEESVTSRESDKVSSSNIRVSWRTAPPTRLSQKYSPALRRSSITDASIHSSQSVRSGRSVQSMRSIFAGIKDTKENKSMRELQKVEDQRQNIMKKHDMSFFGVLTCMRGTVIQSILMDPFFYAVLITYIVVRVAVRAEMPHIAYINVALSNIDLGVVAFALTFFLLFYVQEVYKRFWTMYMCCMSMQGAIFNLTLLCQASLPGAEAYRLVRYANATHMAIYVGLSEAYDFEKYFEEANKMYHVLIPSEVDRLVDIGMGTGNAFYQELLAWCCTQVANAYKKDLIDHLVADRMRDNLFRLRGKAAQVYDTVALPIPFFYYHFLCVLSVMYLPLFAIQMGLNAGTNVEESYSWFSDVVFGLIVLLQASFVIGLRVLAQKLCKPFGHEIEHFTVMAFIDTVWRCSHRILAAQAPENDASMSLEKILVKKRKSIGDAYNSSRKLEMPRRFSSHRTNMSETTWCSNLSTESFHNE